MDPKHMIPLAAGVSAALPRVFRIDLHDIAGLAARGFKGSPKRIVFDPRASPSGARGICPMTFF